MAKAFKKKNDLPPSPKMPTPNQILEDLKDADSEDPVFYESSNSEPDIINDDSYRIAKEFMMTTSKLRDLTSLLETQKCELQDSYEQLCIMSENIRKQATEALSNIY